MVLEEEDKGVIRSQVSCKRVWPEPVKSCKNLGAEALESGQSLDPTPPAGITAWNLSLGLLGFAITTKTLAHLGCMSIGKINSGLEFNPKPISFHRRHTCQQCQQALYTAEK
jgi:hypothetical protein